MKKLVAFGVVMMISVGIAVMVGCGSNTAAKPSIQQRAKVVSEEPQEQKTGDGMAAVGKAAEAKKYLFVLAWKEDNGEAAAMRGVLEKVIKETADRADSIEVDITAVSEQAIVDKFDLNRAPVPIILALAPNGAVAGTFRSDVDQKSLTGAFVTPCTAECMKLLQNNKLVLLCVQNGTTTSNDEAMAGVLQFQEDEGFAEATEIVMLDPANTAEEAFLKDLEVDPKTTEAVTVFLAPPGMPIAKFEGGTTKEDFVAILKSSGACGPGGCGPGGCGPGGCGPGGCGGCGSGGCEH